MPKALKAIIITILIIPIIKIELTKDIILRHVKSNFNIPKIIFHQMIIVNKKIPNLHANIKLY